MFDPSHPRPGILNLLARVLGYRGIPWLGAIHPSQPLVTWTGLSPHLPWSLSFAGISQGTESCAIRGLTFQASSWPLLSPAPSDWPRGVRTFWPLICSFDDQSFPFVPGPKGTPWTLGFVFCAVC